MAETLSVADRVLIKLLRLGAVKALRVCNEKKIPLIKAVEHEVQCRGGFQFRTPVNPLMFMLAENQGMGLALRICHNHDTPVSEFLLIVVNSAPEADQFMAMADSILEQLETELPKWRTACEQARERAAQLKF